jgi:STAM-binding protein
LGLTELKKHPSYKNPENKKNIKTLNKVRISCPPLICYLLKNVALFQNCAEALDAMEKMKPKLDKVYENYVAQVEKTEKEAQEKSVADQTSQWQAQYRSVDVNKNWSLQDELKGIPGVGQKREQKYEYNRQIK